MEDLINEFTSQKKYAVAGSFKDETKYAYQILKKLKNKGVTVYPINPTLKEVEGLKCYKSVMDLPETVDVINVVTPPAVTENIVKQCSEKGIKRVWMQPGAESQDAINFCNTNSIKVIYNTCLLRA
ncbi:MAG: CoA-binding protein [Endomicrobiales bacterium]|nr:CoA-binding protein [Endomicrobiales bacterium]